MAKDDDFDFEFDDMPDFESGGGSRTTASFFKDLAKGIVIGAAEKFGEYVPAANDTKESLTDMTDQIRDQAYAVQQMKSKLDPYTRLISDNTKQIISDIKNTPGLMNKIGAFEKGVDKMRKDTAYQIDFETAASLDPDAMWDDSSSSESGSGTTVTAGKSTSQVDATTSSKLRNEKLGLDPMAGVPNVNANMTSGRGGNMIVNKFGDMYGNSKAKLESERLGNEVLRESMFAVGSSIVSQQSKIFKQTTIINTKQHLEKMGELRRISEASVLEAKLLAEKLAPAITQMSARMEKVEAQLTDTIALIREANENVFSRMSRDLAKRSGRKNISDFVTAYGGIDLGGLYKHLTNEVKDTANGMGLGMITGMKDMLPMMLMSGKTSLGEIIGKNIGKMAMMPFKGKLTGIGDQIQTLIPTTMMSAYEKMSKSDNPLLSGFASLLNIDTGTKRTVDLDTRNRKVSFDMVTRRSIVEVIPQLLAKIHQAVSGGSEELAFDHKTGQFTTKSVMQKRIQSQIDDSGMASLGSVKYKMKNLDKSIDDKSMTSMLRTIMLEGGTFDPNDPQTIKKFMDRFKDEGIDLNTSKKFINLVTRKMSGTERSELSTSINRARSVHKSELDRKSIDLMEYGQGSMLGGSQIDLQIEDLERRKRNLEDLNGSTGGLNASGTDAMIRWKEQNAEIDAKIAELKSVRSSTQGEVGEASAKMDPLTKMYKLLLNGIIVYPKTVVGIPKHIKAALGAEAKLLEERKSQAETIRKASEDYENIQRRSHEAEAEELENYRNLRHMGFLGRMRHMLGGEDSSLAQGVFGDDSLTGKLYHKITGSKIYKAASTVKTKVDSVLDATSDTLNRNVDSNGLNFGGVKDDIKNSEAGQKIAAETKKAQTAVDKFAKSMKTTSGRKDIIDAAIKLSSKARDAILSEKDKLLKTKQGKTVVEILEKAKTKEGRNTLKAEVKSFGKLHAETLKGKVDSMKDQFDSVKESFNAKVSDIKNSEAGQKIAAEASGTASMIKERGESFVNKSKSAAQDILTKIKEGFFGTPKPGQKEVDNETDVETPKNMQTNMSTESMDKSTREKLKNPKGLGLVGIFGAMMTGTMSKLNRVLFGKDDSQYNAEKNGFLGKVFEKMGGLTKSVTKFLFGDKKEGTFGIVQQVAGPAMRVVEDARHKIMKKLINPFKAIGESMQHSLKWGIRDGMEKVSNLIVRFKGTKAEREAKKAAKAQKKAEKLAKINAKRAAKGKAPISATLLGRMGDIAMSPLSLGTKMGMGIAGHNMRKMLEQGKISQEDYDEWLAKQGGRDESEDARHKAALEEIGKFQEQLDLSRVKDQELKAKLAGYKEANAKQKAKVENMTWNEIKADQKRAKEQRKLNAAKIKRGEKLTEEEQYGALTEREKLYRMEDDAKKKLKSEVDRQKETENKYRTEMEKSRTDLLSGILYRISRGAAGSPYGHDKLPNDKSPTSDTSVSEEIHSKIKAEQAFHGGENSNSEPTTDSHIDIHTGSEEGSRADQEEDARRSLQDRGNEAMIVVAEKLDNLIPSKDGKKKKDDEEKEGGIKGLLKGIVGMLGNIGTLAMGLGSVALGGLAVKGITNWGKNIKDRWKNEGWTGGIGELTGIDSAGDSKFNSDGTEKGAFQQTLDRFKAGRFIFQHKGLQKTAKLLTGGASKIIKGGGNLVGGAIAKPIAGVMKTLSAPGKLIQKIGGSSGKLGTVAQKVAGLSEKAGKLSKAGGTIGSKITGLLENFFKVPAIKSKVGSTAAGKLIKTIGAKVAGSAAGKFAGSALKFLSGPIGIAAMAAKDFGVGAAQAKRYFKIGANDKATAGMRIAAGVANALNSNLLLGLVPMDWLVDKVYRAVADPKAEAELDQKQNAFRERAAALGVDPERLNGLENKTLGKKFFNLFKSEDKKLKEEAALMGMDVEDYKVWKQKYENQKNGKDEGVETGKAKIESMIASGNDVDIGSSAARTHAKDIIDQSHVFGRTRDGEEVTRSVMDAAIQTSGDMAKITAMDAPALKKMVEILEMGKKQGDTGAAEALKVMRKEQGHRAMTAIKDSIKAKVTGVWNGAKTGDKAIANAAKWLGSGALLVGKKVLDFNKFMNESIHKGLSKGVETFKSGAAFIGGKIAGGVKTLAENSKEFVANAKDKITSGISNVAGKIGEGLKDFASGFVTMAKGLGEAAKAKFKAMWDGIKNLASKIKEKASNLINGAKDWASNTWDNVKSGASSVKDNVVGFASGTVNKMMGVKDAVTEWASNAWDNVKSGASSAWENVKSGAAAVGEKIWDGTKWVVSHNPAVMLGKWAFGKIRGASDAIKNFKTNRKAMQAEVEKAFQSDPQAAIALGDMIEDPRAKGQQKTMTTLSPEFAKRVNAFLNDPRVKGKGVTIREGYRSPLTQYAYYSKGRAPAEVTDALMKKAGFPSGINFWTKNFQGPDQNITWSLASNHFDGNAVDLEPGKVGYDALGAIAKDYGIDWGGYWQGPKDKPHFEINKNFKGKIDNRFAVETQKYQPSPAAIALESSSEQSKTASGSPTPETANAIAKIEGQNVSNTAGATMAASTTSQSTSSSTTSSPAVSEPAEPKVSDPTINNDIHFNAIESLAESATIAKNNAAAVETRIQEQKEAKVREESSVASTAASDQAHSDMVAQTQAIENQTRITSELLAKIWEEEQKRQEEIDSYAYKALEIKHKKGYDPGHLYEDPEYKKLLASAPCITQQDRRFWADKQYVDKYAAQYADIGT